MTSVRSLRLPSSGNSIIWIFIFLVSFSGCGLFKKAKKKVPEKDVVIIKDDDIRIDTIQWEKIPEDELPPIVKDKEKIEDPYKAFKKSKYNLALFIPFEAKNKVVSESDLENEYYQKFINYYAGVRLALEELKNEGMNLEVTVYDSERSPETVTNNLMKLNGDSLDVIVGPYERKGLQLTADYGKENKVAVISPWLASTRITDDNPYYVQLRPSLSSHYFKIIDHINQNFNLDEIVLVGRNTQADKNRIAYFQRTYAALNNNPLDSAIHEFYIYEDSLNYGDRAFDYMFSRGDKKAIILPHWNYNDEDFLYGCLRRLNIEKVDAEIYVYGMPILYDSEKLDFDFYRNLNIRICLSEFVDWDDIRVKNFERKYFEQFGGLPTSDAYEGFDMVKFIGNNLRKYGINFHMYLDDDQSRYLQTSFDIQKVYDEEDEQFENIKYLENRHLDLIQYIDNKFVKIDGF